MAKSKLQKKKKCKVCESEYTPQRIGQKVCSPKCSFEWVKQENAKEYDKETKRRKQALKTLSDHLRDAQREFNKFIRLRDYDEPCISCGANDYEIPDTAYGKWDCGHYKTRGGFPELRFEEDNAHKQCKKCNGGAGAFSSNERTVSERYRENLIKKIGLERVEAIEGPHEAKKYTIDDVIEIKKKYRKKWKELEKQQN